MAKPTASESGTKSDCADPGHEEGGNKHREDAEHGEQPRNRDFFAGFEHRHARRLP